MIAVEQEAALLAATGPRGQQRRALVISEAIELFLNVGRVAHAVGDAFDQFGAGGAVVVEQSVGAGHAA